MDTSTAMQVFTQRAESDQAPGPVVPLPQSIQIRPIGAQAITVRRDPSTVLANLKQNAAAFGDEWVYSWDVNDKHSKRPDGKTTIEGPTVKLANDLARTYGNCTLEVTRVDDTGTHWVFFAKFIDFESGYEYTRAFQQRKAQGQGQGMQADRAQDMAFQIGQSKALRNCLVNALGSYTDFALSAAKHSQISRVEARLADYRERVVERLTSYGALARVEKTWATTAKDWDARTVAKLVAQLQAVKEGMTTIEELYPDPDAPPPGENKPRQLETFAAEGAAHPSAENAPAAGKTEKAPLNPPTKNGQRSKRGPAAAPKPPAAVAVEQQQDQAGGKASASPEVCPHCGRENGQHDPACPLLSKRPDPTDAEGAPVAHDPQTGEAFDGGKDPADPLAMPSFLKRPAEPGPAKVADDAEMRAAAVKKFPGMSKPWLDGYVARARGAAKTEIPNYEAQGLSPMSVRHFGAGWDARDIEEADGKEAQNANG